MKHEAQVVLAVLCWVTAATTADISIAGYTFDDNAFADEATYISGGPPTLSFSGTGDINQDLLMAAGPNISRYIFGEPILFNLDFLDNRMINDAGADLVLFELGTDDSAEVAIRIDSGAGWTAPQSFMMTDTGFTVDVYRVNAVAIELDLFGVPAQDLIQRIQLNNVSTGTTVSSSICAVGALNSVVPEPTTMSLLAIGGFLLRQRFSSYRTHQ